MTASQLATEIKKLHWADKFRTSQQFFDGAVALCVEYLAQFGETTDEDKDWAEAYVREIIQ